MRICLCHLRYVAKDRLPGYLAECLRVGKKMVVVINGRKVTMVEILDAEVARISEEYRIVNIG